MGTARLLGSFDATWSRRSTSASALVFGQARTAHHRHRSHGIRVRGDEVEHLLLELEPHGVRDGKGRAIETGEQADE